MIPERSQNLNLFAGTVKTIFVYYLPGKTSAMGYKLSAIFHFLKKSWVLCTCQSPLFFLL